MHSSGPPSVEKGSRDCLEHLWTVQSSPRPRSNSYFYLFASQSAPDTAQIQLRPPLNEVSYDPFGTIGGRSAHLRSPSEWRKFPTRPPNCYWAIIIIIMGGHNRMLLWDTAGSSKMPLCGKNIVFLQRMTKSKPSTLPYLQRSAPVRPVWGAHCTSR